ncbi:hypothetical protein AFCA_002469 [Aspergillus flavus]|nr:hypothetical protein AFCA_002469 [Aspergillus flavus]
MLDMCKDELLYSQKLPAQNTGVQPLESAKLISALDPMRILTWSRCPSSAASDSESRRPALSIRSLNESVGRHSTAKKMLVRPSELQKFKLIPLCCKSVLSTLHSGVAFAKGDMPSIWKLMSSNEFLR